MSQTRFGNKIGVSGKTISAYETGRSVPPLKVLESISREYDVEIVHLKSEKKNTLMQKVARIKSSLSYIENVLQESLSL